MSRRSTAMSVAFGLLVLTWIVASLVPVPYVIYRPGPTVDLLGKTKAGEIVAVNGTKAYRDNGELRLLTVVPTGPDNKVNLPEAMLAWLLPSEAVYRYSDIYQPADTSDQEEAEGQVDMVNSQDAATASALHELGYTFGTSVQVLGVTRGGPGDGALEVHDRILAVDGVRTTSIESVVSRVKKVTPGQKVTLKIERAGKTETVRIKTVPSASDKSSSALKITIGNGYEFPVDVHLRINSQIGGPSAGLMFALAIYDTLTPGSLTGGADVAGTGEIDAKGHIGGIGGIQQKMVAAQAAGAKLFLAPVSNCDEVRGGPYDPHKMRITKVATLHQAIAAVNAWRSDHDAKLPAC